MWYSLKFGALFLIGFAGFYTQQRESKSLIIRSARFNDNNGFARFAIYNNPELFCNEGIKPYREVSAPIIDGAAMAVVYDLPDGQYAVTVLHDENEDFVMNYNFIGIPKEGFGFSNNPSIHFSKPKFKDCSFKITQGMVTEINLQVRYFFK